jgi:hypothetical protein
VPEHALLRGKSGDRPTVETGTAGAEFVANPGGSAEHWQCASGGFNSEKRRVSLAEPWNFSSALRRSRAEPRRRNANRRWLVQDVHERGQP